MYFNYGRQFIKHFYNCWDSSFSCVTESWSRFCANCKSAIKNDSKDAIGVALGITIANAVYISLCLIGIGSILAASALLMIILKIIGGLFLIYLAVQALQARKSSYSQLDINESISNNLTNTTFLKEFVAGFISGIFNPKNLLFYLSLFTVVLTPEVSFAFKLSLGIWMTIVVFLWDTSIIFCCQHEKYVRSLLKPLIILIRSRGLY